MAEFQGKLVFNPYNKGRTNKKIYFFIVIQLKD